MVVFSSCTLARIARIEKELENGFDSMILRLLAITIPPTLQPSHKCTLRLPARQVTLSHSFPPFCPPGFTELLLLITLSTLASPSATAERSHWSAVRGALDQ